MKKLVFHCDIYRLLYVYLLIRMLFSKYVLNSSVWDISFFVISILFLIQYATKSKSGRRLIKNCIFVCIVIICASGINIYFTGSSQYWLENVYDIFKSNYIIFVVVSMILIRREKFSICLESSFVFLNAFGVINLLIVTLQELIHGFMIRPALMELNAYYPDLCAGFFGYNGTHRMTYFYCFLAIYNFYMIKYRIKHNKKYFQIFTILMIIWNLIASKGNENTSYIVFVILYTVLYYANIAYIKNGKTSIKFLKKLIYPIAGIGFVAYAYSINVTGEIGGKLVNKISAALHSSGSMAQGSSERIGIIVKSFYDGVALNLGYGIGANKWSDSTYRFMGFRHFGLSSASSIIALGGIWFFLLFCYILLRWYNMIFLSKQKLVFHFTIASLLLLSTLYTDIVTSDITLFWYTMFIVILSFTIDRIIERKTIYV